MKKHYIVGGLSALTIMATAAGMPATVKAAGNNSDKAHIGNAQGMYQGRGLKVGIKKQLSAAELADFKAKKEAIKAAEAAGDYNAWVIAVKALDANSPLLKQINSADKFKTYLDNQKKRQEQVNLQQQRMAAVQAALTAGNYSAWVAAIKAFNEQSPLLSKITAENFSKYVQANNLRQQADAILKELGVNAMSQPGFGSYGWAKGHFRK